MTYTEIWHQFYSDRVSIPYYMSPKEASNLKQLFEKVKWFKEQQGVDYDPLVSFSKFLYKIEDVFTLEQLNPSMINSRFQIILQQMLGKKVKKPKKENDIYYSQATILNDEEKQELQRVVEGYARLKRTNPKTRGEALRMVVRGTEAPAPTQKLMVTRIDKETEMDL